MTEFQRRLEANIRESLRFAVGEVQDDAVAHMVAGVNAVLDHPSAPAPEKHVAGNPLWLTERDGLYRAHLSQDDAWDFSSATEASVYVAYEQPRYTSPPSQHLEGPQPCGIADPSTRDCPNMKEVGGGFDGERYRCAVCGKGYFLDYEEMK